MNWKVPYINIPQQYLDSKEIINKEFERVMSQGSFILRDDVKLFEKNMAEYLGIKNVIGVNSGTDALYITMKLLGLEKGDEVITVAHTFVATLASITHMGSTPVLVDIDYDYNMNTNLIESKITNKTKAILPVHLNGRICNMDAICEIAKKHGLLIVEDAAQALGAKYKKIHAGNFGLAGTWSCHPMKTLGCAGDGGFIGTNDDDLAEKAIYMRDHGQKTKTALEAFGYNSRLDNLQAAILNIKFKKLDEWVLKRRQIASEYDEKLSELPIKTPPPPSDDDNYDSYNSYVIMSSKRDSLHDHLRNNGVEVFVHISKPLYKHKKLNLSSVTLKNNEKICGEILSLPIYPELKESQLDYVINCIKTFYN